ncbi:hypothetical protein ABD86_09935 [Paenibacillus alvei]|nr:hypothetical protein [Paenibacillus alvei]MBG9744268.1 hypothetical protein [Paenibacillus alvei]
MVINKQKTTINVSGEPFLDKMLNDGESPNKCAVWCIKSTASYWTMYEYAKKHRATIIGDSRIWSFFKRLRNADKCQESQSGYRHSRHPVESLD